MRGFTSPFPSRRLGTARRFAAVHALGTAFLLAGFTSRAAEFWAAPTGKPDGDGSRARPWDLQTALRPPPSVRPGDVISMEGGTYSGNFVSRLTGSSNAPITLRGAAGARATIDGIKHPTQPYPLTIEGAWTIYRDFEVIHSATWQPDAPTPVAVQCVAPHTRLVNLVLHDAGQGIGCWMGAHNAEIYGCLIYHNGADSLEHGIYLQNDAATGTKRVVDNLIFNNSGFGIHAYTQGGQLTGIEFRGNIVFNNGSKQSPATRHDNIFVGGIPPADQILVADNCAYHSSGSSAPNVRLSYRDHIANPHGRLVVSGNYLVGGSVFIADDWREIVFTNNLLAGSATLARCRPPPGRAAADYAWDHNRYHGASAFALGSRLLSYPEWRATTSLDAASQWSAALPAQNHVVLRTNRYQPGRAHLAVFNWTLSNNVPVEVGGVLRPGDSFELRNAQDYFGPPPLRGVYQGGPLSLPMTNLVAAPPQGRGTATPPTGPLFNAFVLLGGEALAH